MAVASRHGIRADDHSPAFAPPGGLRWNFVTFISSFGLSFIFSISQGVPSPTPLLLLSPSRKPEQTDDWIRQNRGQRPTPIEPGRTRGRSVKFNFKSGRLLCYCMMGQPRTGTQTELRDTDGSAGGWQLANAVAGMGVSPSNFADSDLPLMVRAVSHRY